MNWPNERIADWQQAYYGANLVRLVDVKKRYDPRNVFASAEHPARLIAQWNSTSAFSSVIQTPQASGMPTSSQNSSALKLKPPMPMPKEPVGAAGSLRSERSLRGHHVCFASCDTWDRRAARAGCR